MGKNLKPTDLDWNTALKHCIDHEEDALRVMLSASDVSISLSHEENDSVIAHKPFKCLKSSGSLDPVNCGDMVNFSLYSVGLSEAASVQLEISPSSDEDVWFKLATLDSASKTFVGPIRALGSRIRAVFTNGTGTIYLVCSG